MYRLIADKINKPGTINVKGNFLVFAKAINGLGIMSADLVTVFEELTLRKDIFFTTMLPWANVLSSIYLIRPYRAWCPICYGEWLETRQIIYDPLIWAISSISICVRHHLKLESKCPSCNRNLLHLASRSKPGFCSRCNQWLGVAPSDFPLPSSFEPENEFEQQKWIHQNIGEILALTTQLPTPPTKERFVESLSRQVNIASFGRINDFSYLVSIGNQTIRQWLKGKQTPTLDMLLKVSFRLKVSLSQLLCLKDMEVTETTASNIQRDQDLIFVSLKESTERIDWSFVESKLSSATKELPPPPLKKLANQIGCSRETLKGRFPELCARILLNFANYHRRKIDLKKARKIVRAAIKENPPPAAQEVFRRLGSNGYALQLYKYFPKEYSIIVSRYAVSSKRPFDIKAVSLYLKKELKEHPPQSLRTLANKGGFSRSLLIEKLPSLCSEVSKRFATYQIALRNRQT
jgi:transcriptional regulator with XRE-family HTH domain